MKTLQEMTIAELWALFTEVTEAIFKAPPAAHADLWDFRRAVNRELGRRGF